MQGFGIYYNAECSLEVKNVSLIDNSNGFISFIGQPNVLKHMFLDKYVHFTNSLLVGQSPWTDCESEIVIKTSIDFRHIGKFTTNISIRIYNILDEKLYIDLT